MQCVNPVWYRKRDASLESSSQLKDNIKPHCLNFEFMNFLLFYTNKTSIIILFNCIYVSQNFHDILKMWIQKDAFLHLQKNNSIVNCRTENKALKTILSWKSKPILESEERGRKLNSIQILYCNKLKNSLRMKKMHYYLLL